MKKQTEHLTMINSGRKAKSNRTEATCPDLLNQIKANSVSILKSKLESLFSHCDDLFFDLSNRANSNNEQNLYFESMRELRIKKAGVTNLFGQKLEQQFVLSLTPQPTASNHDSQSLDSLSLVQKDDVEQSVAINSMIKKARTACQESLHTLNIRLDHLIESNRINSDNNPIDPQQICSAFAEACELFEIEIKARIIIFKQFERLVAAQLISLYTTANDLLINAGILPKINLGIKKSASTEAPQQAQAQTSFLNEGVNYNLQELANMLANVRQLGLQLFPNYCYFTQNPGPVMTNVELVTALSSLNLAASADIPTNDLRQTVSYILAQTNPQQPNALQQPDEDIINLVSMFFDFVLDDKNLPMAIQALVSRLQIPILKLALKDRSFFNDGKHPARKLVNLIASIGFGWDEKPNSAQNSLNEKISCIIQDIANQEEDALQLISEKVIELETLLAQHERRSTLAEKRTQEAAEGQAKTIVARQTSQEVLFRQLDNAKLPTEIIQFLIEQWQQLLTLTHIKFGEESPEWLHATQASQDLIWACQFQQDEKSKQRLTKIRESLIDTLSKGLNQITLSEDEQSHLLNTVKQHIEKIQQNLSESPSQPLTKEQRESLNEGKNKSWQEMTAVERQQAQYAALTYDFIKQAESLPINSWLSYQDSKAGKILRCKLSSRIEATDTYIFVNRFGFKVLEKKRKDFALDMQQKRVELMEQGLLFDRAMSNITGKIRTLNPA